MNLTKTTGLAYDLRAAVNPVALDLSPQLTYRRTAPIEVGAFLCPPYISVMASRAWSHFGGPVSCEAGGDNSLLRLATLIITKFGKSPTYSQETING